MSVEQGDERDSADRHDTEDPHLPAEGGAPAAPRSTRSPLLPARRLPRRAPPTRSAGEGGAPAPGMRGGARACTQQPSPQGAQGSPRALDDELLLTERDIEIINAWIDAGRLD